MSITVKPAKNSHPVTVEVPSSKSYLNRALIIAALTETPVRLNNVSEFDDSRAMIDGLKTLGLQITQSEDSLVVENSDYITVFDCSLLSCAWRTDNNWARKSLESTD